jgi:hypothetical protein
MDAENLGGVGNVVRVRSARSPHKVDANWFARHVTSLASIVLTQIDRVPV